MEPEARETRGRAVERVAQDREAEVRQGRADLGAHAGAHLDPDQARLGSGRERAQLRHREPATALDHAGALAAVLELQLERPLAREGAVNARDVALEDAP